MKLNKKGKLRFTVKLPKNKVIFPKIATVGHLR